MKTIFKCTLWSLFAFISVANLYGKGIANTSDIKENCIVSINGTKTVTIEQVDALVRLQPTVTTSNFWLNGYVKLSKALSEDVSIYINGWIGDYYFSGAMVVKAGNITSPVKDLTGTCSGTPSSAFKVDMKNATPAYLIRNITVVM